MPDLPVAKDHKAIQNKISLLLSSRQSLIKNLNPTPISHSTSSRTPSSRHQSHAEQDEDQDMFKHSNPNEGVGFVRQSTDPANNPASKQDKALRGRLMGRQKKEAERKRKLEESESEEEQGRSALGKRKRREPQTQTHQDEGDDRQHDMDTDAVNHDTSPELQTPSLTHGTKVKKKNKNKSKNKNKKTNAHD